MPFLLQKFSDLVQVSNNVFVALSGGADSIVMAHLLSKIEGVNVIALHVNHGISDNANKWSSFCEGFCEDNNIEFRQKKFNLKGISNLEEAARNARYDFFASEMTEGDLVFTGHHLDDQVETFLMRAIRGSGVDGLSSMSEVRDLQKGKLVRPLLGFSKDDILSYAMKNDLKWVEDESNQSSDYDRNFIRNEIIPLLKKRWPSVSQGMSRTAAHCESASKTLKKLAENDFDKVKTDNLDSIEINDYLKKLNPESRSLVFRLWLSKMSLKAIGTSKMNEINRFINSTALSDNPNDQKLLVDIDKKNQLRMYDGKLWIVSKNKELTFSLVESSDEMVVKINAKIKDVLVRVREDGDRMFFRGKPRKLSYIFNLFKIPHWKREYLPVVYDKKTGEILSVANIIASNCESKDNGVIVNYALKT